jgi:hypothetical protein
VRTRRAIGNCEANCSKARIVVVDNRQCRCGSEINVPLERERAMAAAAAIEKNTIST